jgi:hypothetical protein
VVLFMSGIAFRAGFFRRSEVISSCQSSIEYQMLTPKLHAEHKRRKQHLYRDASSSELQYIMDDEQDPLVAVVVPEYQGPRSAELEAELESRFSGDQSGSDTSGGESDS